MSADNKEGGSGWTVLGGGCFWCLEAVFQRLAGVTSVASGYAGGSTAHPTYEQVCSGTTGHAEVVRIGHDLELTSYADILELFWRAHDPTTHDRQGADVGPQYRSLILTGSDEQRTAAELSRTRAQKLFAAKIITEIKALERFWPAEEDHQDYYNRHGASQYCALLIAPKLKSLSL